MMEIIRVLGVDPSVRNSGMAIVCYNTETEKFHVEGCQVLVNPQKYKGTEAILNMLDMMKTESQDEIYQRVDTILVESPPVMFNKTWSSSTLSMLAHVSGGAVAILGLEKAYLFKPSEWNKTRKKEVTHAKTIAILGNPETWGYKKQVKSDKFMEHILDAASMALWYMQESFVESDD